MLKTRVVNSDKLNAGFYAKLGTICSLDTESKGTPIWKIEEEYKCVQLAASIQQSLASEQQVEHKCDSTDKEDASEEVEEGTMEDPNDWEWTHSPITEGHTTISTAEEGADPSNASTVTISDTPCTVPSGGCDNTGVGSAGTKDGLPIQFIDVVLT